MFREEGLFADYKDGNWTIVERLDTMSLCQFSGTFDEVIAFLQKEKSYWDGPVTKMMPSILALGLREGSERCEVTYDRVDIREGFSTDVDCFEIWGTRKPIQKEEEFLEKYRLDQEKKQESEMRKHYEKLKQIFGD